MTKNKQLALYVWRSGLAEVADLNDPYHEAAICIATGDIKQLEECLITCRLMKDGTGRYLVNGIPEAETDEEAGDALEIFKLICENRLSGKKAFKGVNDLRAEQMDKYKPIDGMSTVSEKLNFKMKG